MEKRKFFSDVLFVQGLNILIKAFWILMIDRLIQDTLPNEDYGRYFSLFSYTVLFIILLDFGINNLNSRMVAVDINYYRQNFTGILTAKLFLAVVFLLVVYCVAWFLGYSKEYWDLLVPLSLFQIFISFNQYLRSNIAATHRFKLDGILAVTDRLLVVLICGSWLWVEQWNYLVTIQNFILLQLSGVILTFILGLIFNIKFMGKFNLKVHFPSLFGLIRQSLPYALLAALMAFYTRIDAVMIDMMLGAKESDRYAMAYRLMDAGNMIAVLLAGMLLPMFSRLLSHQSDVSKLTGLSFKLLVIPAFLGAVILALHPVEILSLMYPSKVDILAPVAFNVLMFSFVSICVIYIYGTLLTAAGDMKFLNWLAAITAVLNVVLNAIVIQQYGVEGAAYATLITQSIFAIGCLYKCNIWRLIISTKANWYAGIGIICISALIMLSEQFFKNHFVHIAFSAIVALCFVVTVLLSSTETLKLMSRRKTQEPSDI